MEAAEEERRHQTDLFDIDRQIAGKQMQLETQRQELERQSHVTSPCSGRVIEIIALVGDVVSGQQPILLVEQQTEKGNDLTAVLFVSPEDGKKVRPGLSALINPFDCESYRLRRNQRAGHRSLRPSYLVSIREPPAGQPRSRPGPGRIGITISDHGEHGCGRRHLQRISVGVGDGAAGGHRERNAVPRRDHPRRSPAGELTSCRSSKGSYLARPTNCVASRINIR